MHWIAEGKTNSEIGIILNCSFYTIKNHIKEIFQRLGVHSRAAAAVSAYRALLAEAMPDTAEERKAPRVQAASRKGASKKRSQ